MKAPLPRGLKLRGDLKTYYSQSLAYIKARPLTDFRPIILLISYLLIALFAWSFSELRGLPKQLPEPASVVPSLIPDPPKAAFQAAADKYQVSINIVGAIYWEEHGGTFPQTGPFRSSGAGAQGPFQFLLSTWDNGHGGGYADDCDGDGKKDIQSIPDAACGAAYYLAANGAEGVRGDSATDETNLRRAILVYNHAEWYAEAVLSEYRKLFRTSQGVL